MAKRRPFGVATHAARRGETVEVRVGQTEEGGDAVAESWGYRCETCGEDGPVDGYNGLAVLRREWEHALAFRVISRRHDLPGDGHNLDLLGEFAGRHRTHDVTAVCLCGQRRSVPLFPGNAPLPRGATGFLHALADDCTDVAALGTFFDFLEEAGLTAAGLRVRKLTPQTGDVLALTGPRVLDLEPAARWLHRHLRAAGKEVLVASVPEGVTLADVSEGEMEVHGWVRAERVAEVVAAERARFLRAIREGIASWDGDDEPGADLVRASLEVLSTTVTHAGLTGEAALHWLQRLGRPLREDEVPHVVAGRNPDGTERAAP